MELDHQGENFADDFLHLRLPDKLHTFLSRYIFKIDSAVSSLHRSLRFLQVKRKVPPSHAVIDRTEEQSLGPGTEQKVSHIA